MTSAKSSSPAGSSESVETLPPQIARAFRTGRCPGIRQGSRPASRQFNDKGPLDVGYYGLTRFSVLFGREGVS